MPVFYKVSPVQNWNKEAYKIFLKMLTLFCFLVDSTSAWQKDGAIAIWIQVPLTHSRVIPIAANQGFTLHHTEGDNIYLAKWLLDCPNRLPAYANHQIGVSGKLAHRIRRANHDFRPLYFPGSFLRRARVNLLSVLFLTCFIPA